MTNYPKILNQLRQRRLDMGANRNSLNTILGQSRSQLQGWEDKGIVPTATSLIKWADALNMDVQLIPREEKS